MAPRFQHLDPASQASAWVAEVTAARRKVSSHGAVGGGGGVLPPPPPPRRFRANQRKAPQAVPEKTLRYPRSPNLGRINLVVVFAGPGKRENPKFTWAQFPNFGMGVRFFFFLKGAWVILLFLSSLKPINQRGTLQKGGSRRMDF